MIRSALVGMTASVLLLAAGCTQEGPGTGTPSSGGSTTASGGSGSGGSGSGGTTSSGGTTASGGTTSSGGSNQSGGDDGSGGVSDEGGTTSSGGSARSGGTTSRGGSTTASGGTTSSGGTTASGGSASGGTTTTPRGTGGATPGTGGKSGTGGAPGTGGSTAGITPADIVPDFDGFYWEGTCSGNVSVSGKNCPLYDNGATTCASGTSWENRGTIRNKILNVKGTTGTTYTINFEVRGVVGARCYQGGKAATTASSSVTGQNNWWYVGGTPSSSGDIWNTYELHVDPPVPNEANVYYLNAAQPSPTWCNKESSYEVKYTASFKVLGGGTMKFTIHDSNCQAQQNCGSNEGSSTCDSPRSNIDLSGMSPAPASSFKQPPTNTVGTKTYYPQWLYFDVKSVTSP